MEKRVGLWILICLTFSCNWNSVVNAKNSYSDVSATIDPKLRIPAGNSIRLNLYGVGVQIYGFNGTSWALKNVSADLYDYKGRKVGFHYFLTEKDANGGQPAWETFNPKSRVAAKSIASVPQTDAISLLLLEATSNQGDKELLGSTSYVQRISTRKGLPPSTTEDAKIGDVYESFYSTLYTFSSPDETGY